MNIVSLPPEEEQTSFDYYNIFKPLKFLYKSYKVSFFGSLFQEE